MFSANSKILIVDDLKTIRTLLTEYLNNIGFNNIFEVGRGDAALSLMKTANQKGEAFDLIFCDWNMPGFTGIDLLNAKNKIPDLKDTPFIMVTVESEKEYVLRAIALGVNDYIVKPFNEKVIVEKLKSVWNSLEEEAAEA